jgi:hypothetical protein
MDKAGNMNFTNYSKVGLSTVKDSSAFKKIQYHSKVNPQSLYNDSSNYSQRYNKIYSLYLNSNTLNESYNYGTMRQHGYSSSASNSLNYGLEHKSVSKMLNYNYGLLEQQQELKHSNSLELAYKPSNNTYISDAIGNVDSSGATTSKSLNQDSYLNNEFSISATNDSKFHQNPYKVYLSKRAKSTSTPTFTYDIDLPTQVEGNSPAVNKVNNSYSYKFKENKSSNLSFLSSDKNIRDLSQSSLAKNNFNSMSKNTNLSSLVSSTIDSEGSASANELSVYNSSLAKWANNEAYKFFSSSDLVLDTSHTPVYSNQST